MPVKYINLLYLNQPSLNSIKAVFIKVCTVHSSLLKLLYCLLEFILSVTRS